MIKKGNQVRAPLDLNEKPNFREYVVGRVEEIDEFANEVLVKFEDIEDVRQFFNEVPKSSKYKIEDISRVKIIEDRLVIYKDEFVARVLSFYKEIDGYNHYYAEHYKTKEILVLNEKDLSIQFDSGEVNPLDLLKNYELHNPVWYKGRVNVSKTNIAVENAPVGLDLLLSSRVYLFSHQINTIMQGLNMDSCRMMLADEVGLGKTIEAAVIYKGLKERNPGFKTLIIVPKTLSNQWKNEFSYKFWTDIEIWNGEEDIENREIIVNLEDIEDFNNRNKEAEYDLMIVDETHRLLKDSKKYRVIYDYSKETENILLLSATPIQERKEEYLQLLKLIKPEEYHNYKEEEFNVLLSKSKRVKNDIYNLVRDLSFYHDEDAGEYYIEDFQDMNQYLKDPILEKLIDKIDLESKDDGYEMVKIILSYISNTYEIEKNIVRNRRIELKNYFSERSREVFTYSMSGSREGFYEVEVYKGLIEYFNLLKDDGNFIVEDIKKLYSGMLSSPWALERLIEDEKNKYDKRYMDKLESINDLIDIWRRMSREELENMEYYEAEPGDIKGRLLYAIDIIDQEYYDKKVVVFTEWKETAEIFSRYLEEKMGEGTVTSFYKGIESIVLEDNVDRFQKEDNCKVLVCDRTGGEGRNFQMADVVFHLDLPWSPVDLEQRIGRLDRIGRDPEKDVESVLILTEDNIEMDLFKLWDEGLNIFEESLSGIEIALNDIENELKEALKFDVAYGLRNSLENISKDIENMKEEVERERYYDYAKNIDSRREFRVKELIDKFEGDDNKLLKDTMRTWSNLVGLRPNEEQASYNHGESDIVLTYKAENFSIRSAQKSLFFPPNTKEALKRSRRKRQIRGTFSKDLAINMEELILFSPGDIIYDSIIKNSLEAFKGKATAVAFKSDVNWTGLVFKWNIEFNDIFLLEDRINPKDTKFNYSEYLPIEQVETYHKCVTSSEDLEEDQIKSRVDEWIELGLGDRGVHLGKRGKESRFFPYIKDRHDSNIEWFKETFEKENWHNMIETLYERSKEEAEEKAGYMVEKDKAKEDMENMVVSEKASNIYFERDSVSINMDKDIIKKNDKILKGLSNPKIELDSVALIWMVKAFD